MHPPSLTEDDIREALRVCFDPELAVNIVDLGLLREIRVRLDEEAPGVHPRYCVSVDLTMRAPNEEREAMLLAQISNRLAGIPAVSTSTVRIVWEPPWTSEWMTAAARQQLGLDRMTKPGLIQISPLPGRNSRANRN